MRDRVRRGAARRAPERARRPRTRGAGRARRQDRRSRRSRGRGRELRRSATRAADGGRRGGRRGARARERRRVRGPRAQRARVRPPRRLRARRGALLLRRDGVVQPRNQNASVRESLEAALADRRARTGGRDPHGRDHQRRLRLPVRGPGRREPRARARGGDRRPRGPTRSFSPTRSESACRARYVGSSRGRSELGVPSAATSTTRGTPGYANALAALEAGATVLDASVGGLGGCPFAPRATGNIATEDLVYLLDGEGVDTGIDLDALIGVSEWLESVLGRRLEGQLYRAGPFPPGVTHGRGRQDRARHLAELDVAGAATQHDRVPVLEERPRAPVAEPDRVGAVPRQLDQRPLASRIRAGDRPRGEEIARSERRAVTVACASCCGIVQ